MKCSFYKANPGLGDRDGSFFLRSDLLLLCLIWGGRHVSLEPF
jgi:hypothetical protein